MHGVHEPKVCLKCGHARTAADTGPDFACPGCGAVYAKVEALQRAKEAVRVDTQARRQVQIEQQALDQAEGAELRANREQERSLSVMAHIVYALYILPIGLTALIGLVIAYVMRSRASGTWVESHFSWQIGTFWRAILALVLALFIGKALLMGSLVLFAAKGTGAGIVGGLGAAAIFYGFFALLLIWCIYRIAKGWISLVNDEAVA